MSWGFFKYTDFYPIYWPILATFPKKSVLQTNYWPNCHHWDQLSNTTARCCTVLASIAIQGCVTFFYWPQHQAKFYKDLIITSYRTLMDRWTDRGGRLHRISFQLSGSKKTCSDPIQISNLKVSKKNYKSICKGNITHFYCFVWKNFSD